jgi:radical SAM superfamily enzyme YgiQ (UPF0313 family)
MTLPTRTLLLITASSPDIRRVRRSRLLDFQQITMPYLAAFCPPHWRVVHVDEAVDPVDLDTQADLVAITFHTPSAFHAYGLAQAFRQRGVPVALGGPHATLAPEEAQAHADVVFVGEAEESWPRFLREFEEGRHASRYDCARPPSLDRVPQARKKLYTRRDLTAGRLFAGRGCPHACDFCVPARMYPGRPRRREVAEVAAEFASFPGRVVIFWDDNLAADPEYAKALFRAIEPHRKGWSSQISLQAAEDDEFLRLAARSGCRQFFVGLESVCQASMDGAGKGFNRVEAYGRLVERIHAHGIAVQAGIVFGFDPDTPDVFDRTVDFLEDSGIQNATFNILTPYPGTPLFHRLEAEGRILTRDWTRYNSREDVVFQPRLMDPEDLLTGFRHAVRRFYSLRGIARRLRRSPVGLWWTLPLNLAYAAALRWEAVSPGGTGLRAGAALPASPRR